VLAARSRRERQIIAAGLVLVVLAAAYFLFWEPAFSATRRLSAQLPRLRAEVEEMRVLQRQIEALRRSPGEARQAGGPRELVQAMLGSEPGLKSARAQWQSQERFSLELAAIDFDHWLALTARLRREAGTRVERCTVVALPQPGLVRVEAVLSIALSEAR
jgi:type II secretory pathway component PulM